MILFYRSVQSKVRVNVLALKARSSKVEGACPKAGTAICVALSGLFVSSPLTQGFGCFAAFTLGFAISRFQRLESFFAHHALTRTSNCTL